MAIKMSLKSAKRLNLVSSEHCYNEKTKENEIIVKCKNKKSAEKLKNNNCKVPLYNKGANVYSLDLDFIKNRT